MQGTWIALQRNKWGAHFFSATVDVSWLHLMVRITDFCQFLVRTHNFLNNFDLMFEVWWWSRIWSQSPLFKILIFFLTETSSFLFSDRFDDLLLEDLRNWSREQMFWFVLIWNMNVSENLFAVKDSLLWIRAVSSNRGKGSDRLLTAFILNFLNNLKIWEIWIGIWGIWSALERNRAWLNRRNQSDSIEVGPFLRKSFPCLSWDFWDPHTAENRIIVDSFKSLRKVSTQFASH